MYFALSVQGHGDPVWIPRWHPIKKRSLSLMVWLRLTRPTWPEKSHYPLLEHQTLPPKPPRHMSLANFGWGECPGDQIRLLFPRLWDWTLSIEWKFIAFCFLNPFDSSHSKIGTMLHCTILFSQSFSHPVCDNIWMEVFHGNSQPFNIWFRFLLRTNRDY